MPGDLRELRVKEVVDATKSFPTRRFPSSVASLPGLANAAGFPVGRYAYRPCLAGWIPFGSKVGIFLKFFPI